MNSADRAGIHEAERGGVRLKVDYERSGNADVIVRLSGEVDLSVEGHLLVMLEEALVGQPSAVVVDLGGLRFLDCAGFRALLKAQSAAEACGCRLTVRDPQPLIERVLRVLQVADILGLPRAAAAARDGRTGGPDRAG